MEEDLLDVSVSKSSEGLISFSFKRLRVGGPGIPSGKAIPAVDPAIPVPLLWSMGNTWSADLQPNSYHFARASGATTVDLSTGVTSTAGVDSAYVTHGYFLTK